MQKSNSSPGATGVAPRETGLTLLPIESQRLYKVAVEQIARLIQTGVLKPGDRLPPERQLSEQLRISRPSVREALIALEAMGLVVTRLGVGNFVVDPLPSPAADNSFRQIADGVQAYQLLEARHYLEGATAELAARNRTEADLVEMENNLLDIESMGKLGPVEFETNLDFHMAVARASKNELLVKFMDVIANQMRGDAWRGVRHALHQQYLLQDSRGFVGVHQEIFAAIQAQDPARARALMEEHMRHVIKRGLAADSTEPSDA